MAAIIWFLNRFLTAWRNALNKRYPKRSKISDGTIGDQRHAAQYSEHNPDRDGSVDAYDMDVNVEGSRVDSGSRAELADIEGLKADFQREKGSQLWIHRGQIANKDIGKWKRRRYVGTNKHDHHVHWQSDAGGEKAGMERPLTTEDDVVPAINSPARHAAPTSIPAWPGGKGELFTVQRTGKPPYRKPVYAAQSRLRQRGWRITVDGRFGPDTEKILKAFQKEKRLSVDGILGPKTWHALWSTRVTD